MSLKYIYISMSGCSLKSRTAKKNVDGKKKKQKECCSFSLLFHPKAAVEKPMGHRLGRFEAPHPRSCCSCAVKPWSRDVTGNGAIHGGNGKNLVNHHAFKFYSWACVKDCEIIDMWSYVICDMRFSWNDNCGSSSWRCLDQNVGAAGAAGEMFDILDSQGHAPRPALASTLRSDRLASSKFQTS